MKLAFLGVGNMAGAILGSLRGVVDDADIILFDRFPEAMARYADRGYVRAVSAPAAAAAADCVIFAVKPQNMPELFNELKAADVVHDKLLVSIAAGVPIRAFTDAFGPLPVVRTMPNTPMLIGEGVIALCRNALVDDAAFAFVRSLFDAAGSTIVLDEADMNKIISVTSSSPAYVFLFIKSIYESGLAQGLADEGLLDAVCDAVIGSAKLVKASDKTPDELIAMVTSKKGTTEQALMKLDEYKFAEGIHEAMLACTRRAEELGRA
ncbi:MAG: pyrroline-5-carboxylate reductase [Clostridia bacterium]|nr:pyrroline-5-carboxylate reductase [Clostridia bacterium]